MVNVPTKYLVLELENRVSKCLLDTFKDFNVNCRNIKQKIIDIMSKYMLDFAYLSAYVAGSANINFGKLHSVYKCLNKEHEKILLAKNPVYFFYNDAKMGCDFFTCDIEAFIMRVFGHFWLPQT